MSAAPVVLLSRDIVFIDRTGLGLGMLLTVPHENGLVVTVDYAKGSRGRRHDGPLRRGMVFDHGGTATEGCERVVVVAAPGTCPGRPGDVAFASVHAKSSAELRHQGEEAFRREVAGGGPMTGLEPTFVVEALDRATPSSWWAEGFRP